MGEIFITRRGGKAAVPSIFGNGSNGDAVISGTVTLPVPVPHQSIVEMQYKSLTINAGAILRAAAWNAGLIIRVQGDCVIHGTIDQSGLAPKTNTGNNYAYPAQLVSGNGGNGGNGGGDTGSKIPGAGGTGMLKRPYGGGYGAGAGSGWAFSSTKYQDYTGLPGGDSTGIDITVSNIFLGGLGAIRNGSGTNTYASKGEFGGGAGAGFQANPAVGDSGGSGGNGPGGNGGSGVGAASSGGGGAGNYGGGVVLLYVGGNLLIDGAIKCNGLNGGNGGNSTNAEWGSGGSGGGGGGGAIYILYKGTYTNTGLLQVNGGAAGTPGTIGLSGKAGSAGGVGSITAIKHTS